MLRFQKILDSDNNVDCYVIIMEFIVYLGFFFVLYF